MTKRHWTYLLFALIALLTCSREASAQAKTDLETSAAQEAATKLSDGDFLGAMQVWTRVIQQGPDKLQGYLQRAKLKRHIGDNTGAAQDLDLALKAYPKSVSCLIERAAIRRRTNDNQGALADLNKAIELQPNKAQAYVHRGWLKMAMGDYAGAGSDYHTAVTINPALKGKLGGLAQPHMSTRLDPDDNGPSINTEAGYDKDKSESGLTVLPDHSQPDAPDKKSGYSQAELAHLNNAAVKQINDGQFEGAIKTLNELIDAAPDYAHARENLTIAHNNWGLELAKRTPAAAAKQFRQALYLDPSQGTSRRNLDAMIREIGKNPKDADDRLALAQESLAGADDRGAFVEASEAARLKNTPAVRAALRKALGALDEKMPENKQIEKPTDQEPGKSTENQTEKSTEKQTEKPAETQVLRQVKPLIITASTKSPPTNIDQKTMAAPPPAVIEQAKAMVQAGQIGDAEELLNNFIDHIKSRAAVDESVGFGMLDLALDTLAGIYLKTGSYVQAQSHLSELITLRENLRDKGDPALGETYREYAKVLSALNRTAEAKVYEAKAEAILDGKEAHQ